MSTTSSDRSDLEASRWSVPPATVPDGGNRYESLVGTRLDALPTAVNYTDLNPDQTRRIVMVAGQSIEIRDNDASSPEIRPVMAIPIGDYNNSATSPAYRSFNVSEPKNGYTGTTWAARFSADFTNNETVEFAMASPEDQPVDDAQADPRLRSDQTHVSFCYVHLQRLANPLLPYHAVNNPYISVDASAMDLTVFNGDLGRESSGGGGTTEFATLERGRRELQGSGRNYAAVPVDQNDLVF
ncbi:MAG: hypothetical protein R3B96_17500 [Pirellulaceae bacterium]